jgi:transposase
LLLETIGKQDDTVNLLMNRAYEDERTGLRAWELQFNLVVPMKRNRVHPGEYDQEVYERQNELERLFRRLKGFRGICTRYDKLARMFTAFIYLACIL